MAKERKRETQHKIMTWTVRETEVRKHSHNVKVELKAEGNYPER